MQQLRDERADYWVSNVVLEDDPEVLNNHYWGVHDSLGELGREYVKAYGASIGADRIAILCAHGDHLGTWLYYDDRRKCRVQTWIDKYDGKYALLGIRVCNPGAVTPIAKKSLLLIPDSTFSDMSVGAGMSHFSLIHPQEGDVEYTIEYLLSELKKS